MAVVTIKSGPITNRDASPRVISNPSVARAEIKEAVGTIETGAADSIASKYIMCQLPSNARVSRVLLSNDAIATAPLADVGIYRTTADGGAVVDVDFFASATALAAAQSHVDITHEADPADAGVGYGQADVEKPLWQALGLLADPSLSYDVVLTLTAATTAIGTVSLKVQYTE